LHGAGPDQVQALEQLSELNDLLSRHLRMSSSQGCKRFTGTLERQKNIKLRDDHLIFCVISDPSEPFVWIDLRRGIALSWTRLRTRPTEQTPRFIASRFLSGASPFRNSLFHESKEEDTNRKHAHLLCIKISRLKSKAAIIPSFRRTPNID
jgi:hypothetical protein